MNRDLYSNHDFTDLKERLNREIQRRGSYKWWDPLTTPSVGEDRSSPLSLPAIGSQVFVNDKTYTIRTPSDGSIEPTRNTRLPAQGENPSGAPSTYQGSEPNSSAAQFTYEEMKNFLVGLSKIHDVNLFYGRDEVPGLAYRDPKGIYDVLEHAESDILHQVSPYLLHLYREGDHLVVEYNEEVIQSVSIDADGNFVVGCDPSVEARLMSMGFSVDQSGNLLLMDPEDRIGARYDPNGGVVDYPNPDAPVQEYLVYFPVENGIHVMPSGESDGEETLTHQGLGVNNFFDDYGAKPGDGNYHPYNQGRTPQVRRDLVTQDDQRNSVKEVRSLGGIKSSTYGRNPRNPNSGSPYPSRAIYTGVPGSCNVACTGLCSTTCDDQCSESCSSTCWARCGNACTSNCGNVCTGCSTMCYSSCKTKCENVSGYACLKAGAKTVKITTSGGERGEPAKNQLTYTTYSCQGCSYSCQFYPNKKTTCWDAGCMSKCFTSCNTACSTSCMGGCVDNPSQDGSSYKTGKGKGCSGGCTLNCIGSCQGVCEGQCIDTCWHGCKQTCTDNCTWECSTNCGNGCEQGCKNGCKGCDGTCESTCSGSASGIGCTGCGTKGGCTSTCQHQCNRNCVGSGCKSICGVDAAGACEANCRINCMSSSCTALCSDQCSNQCTTCVNSCGWQCGACSSMCSTGCGAACEITCTATCEHSCEMNCVQSCSEDCGGCSNLCFSCIGMCIGVCSVKCENGCSSCSNLCGWWCDSNCNQECFGNCDDQCISTCSGSCATYLESQTTFTDGPEVDPIAEGYQTPHPQNREEERESFRLIKEDE